MLFLSANSIRINYLQRKKLLDKFWSPGYCELRSGNTKRREHMKTTRNSYAICKTPAQRRFLHGHLHWDSGLVGIMWGKTMFDAGLATDGYRTNWSRDAAMIEFVRSNFKESTITGRRGVAWFRRDCVRATRAVRVKALALVRPLSAGTGRDTLRGLIENPDWVVGDIDIADITYTSLRAKIKSLSDSTLTPAECDCLAKYIWDLRDYALYLAAIGGDSLVIYDLGKSSTCRQRAESGVVARGDRSGSLPETPELKISLDLS
jgi:hypothetical protein